MGTALAQVQDQLMVAAGSQYERDRQEYSVLCLGIVAKTPTSACSGRHTAGCQVSLFSLACILPVFLWPQVFFHFSFYFFSLHFFCFPACINFYAAFQEWFANRLLATFPRACLATSFSMTLDAGCSAVRPDICGAEGKHDHVVLVL